MLLNLCLIIWRPTIFPNSGQTGHLWYHLIFIPIPTICGSQFMVHKKQKPFLEHQEFLTKWEPYANVRGTFWYFCTTFLTILFHTTLEIVILHHTVVYSVVLYCTINWKIEAQTVLKCRSWYLWEFGWPCRGGWNISDRSSSLRIEDSGALEVNIRSITGHEPQCRFGSSDPHHVLTSQCEEMKSDPGHFSCWKSFNAVLQQRNAYYI